MKLNQKLCLEYISQRFRPDGGKLTYTEGWKIINLANEVFGFNGWSSNVVNLMMDYIDFSEESKKFNVGITAIVRVTLRDEVFHEDIGYGILENSKRKGAALDKVRKKQCKRSLRNFRNLLGNCLYNQSYAQEIVKIKVSVAKFDKSQLHHRPKFDESRQQPTAGPSTSMMTSIVKMEHATKPLSSIPPHIRPGATPNAKPNTSHNTPSKLENLFGVRTMVEASLGLLGMSHANNEDQKFMGHANFG
ncbi:hypothetical protein PILCRDRAFT_57843 [Piloderma croceum F 1598]|uniref:Rad52/22 double-strand break repair protein n=1 Tax=Piloderma croceum (strain F 1598) TaxID=765440 RepID=A0A0C3CQ20_PILCF|nr:hypothetical protein PILCRDRAFT_57843 [Piloderma croceum F 1598]